jgi:hypothetical protein
MLENTIESLENHLALEVMHYPYMPESWNPTAIAQQAWRCMDKMGVWSMEYDGLGSYGVDVNTNSSVLHNELIMAMCIACALETGWLNPED